MSINIGMKVRVMFEFCHSTVKTIALVGLLALAGCVEDVARDVETSEKATTEKSDPAATGVALEEVRADSVTASDVIKRSRRKVKRTGEIYLMRGLANVFSRGIDDMAVELRGAGYDAANFSYKIWQPIAADIVRRARSRKVSYPIVIVGHSLGANESSKFANYLGTNNVDVALVVAFDPVETGRVGRGVSHFVNYYLPKSKDKRIGAGTKAEDNTVHAVTGFTGKLRNIDVSTEPSVTHINIDKHRPYQVATLSSIERLTRKRRTPSIDDRMEGP